MLKPSLTIEQGQFVLRNTSINITKKNAHWKELSPWVFATHHLGEAGKYREFAAPDAESFLKRSFQEHYELPEIQWDVDARLDDHQQIGVRWVLERKRSYLAHAPGAGKTIQAIVASIFSKGEGKTIFIVPPNLIENWVNEIHKVCEWIDFPDYFWPGLCIIRRSDTQEDVDWSSEIILCPDTMLTKDWVYRRISMMQKKFIAVDEASRFKEPWSDRSLGFYGGTYVETKNKIEVRKSYPGIFKDARHVVFLDGSPMPNRPMELWAPTYALHPEAIDCMSQDDFGYKYCGARPNERGQWEFNHSSNEELLRSKLQNDFMHVVTEDQLTHPERLRSLLFTDEDVRSSEHKSWERKHLSSFNFDDIDEDMNQGDMARFRKELGVSKIPWVANYVNQRLTDKNESILLFAWHRDVCEGLAEKLKKWNPGVVMGGTAAATREGHFDDFQNGRKKLLIMNIVAGGRGHNLQKASRAIFAEYAWSDEMNKQCEKRGSRRGSILDRIRCDYIVAKNSMDEPILNSVFTKEKRAKRIIG